LSISLSKDEKNIPALLLLAELKLKSADNLGALELLNQILEIEENPKALFMRGSIYLKLEDRNKACTDLNRSGELGFFDAYEMINKYCVKTKKK
jgi:regulator of sirC expression with transglutaminase-like and TPR domain